MYSIYERNSYQNSFYARFSICLNEKEIVRIWTCWMVKMRPFQMVNDQKESCIVEPTKVGAFVSVRPNKKELPCVAPVVPKNKVIIYIECVCI